MNFEREQFWKTRAEALEQENKDLNSLFELQQARVSEATKLWQAAHNKPNVLPDLGTLVEWLIKRHDDAVNAFVGVG